MTLGGIELYLVAFLLISSVQLQKMVHLTFNKLLLTVVLSLPESSWQLLVLVFRADEGSSASRMSGCHNACVTSQITELALTLKCINQH